jgi:hypothetical protein
MMRRKLRSTSANSEDKLHFEKNSDGEMKVSSSGNNGNEQGTPA